jgi:hypothetical protein
MYYGQEYENSIWYQELKKIQQCPQAQDSLQDQLLRLRIIANRFGLYDAADYLRDVVKE